MRIHFIAILLLFVLPTSMQAAALPESILLSTHDLCPYGCFDKNGIFDGDAIRVVRHALSRMGISLNLEVVPWERAQLHARTGQSDGFFAASRNKLRDKEGVMSAIIAEQKWNWYMLKSNPMEPTDPHFKESARVASFIGANMLKWLRTNGYKVPTTPPTTKELAKMLVHLRLDAVLANNRVMDHILKEMGVSEKVKSYTLRNKPLGVYFSKRFINRHPGFLDIFNRHVEEYRSAHP